MFEPFTWQLLLRAAPSTVFCSLVRAASQEGRVCGVEDFGTVLTYTPTHSEVELVGRMRAGVQACEGGTLVTITAADRALIGAAALAVQARSVAALIHQLRLHYSEQALAATA